MVIDAHHHIIPKSVVDLVRRGDVRFEAEIQVRGNQEWMVHKQGYAYPLFDKFYDFQAKKQDLAAANLDAVVLSPAPPMFYYWQKPETAAELASLVNDGIAEMAEGNQQIHQVMATVPMQNPKASVKELERVKNLYDIRAVEIGTSIEGVNLDDPRFNMFFEAADALGITLFLHPYYVGDKSGMQNYYFTNLVGNPLDTALAAGSLIFGGVLDRFKNIKVMLAHGGGYFPYQIGRFNKGYQERKESRTCEQEPSAYLNRFYFDTLTFHPQALEFLVKLVGAERVVLGSDYPFDMGTLKPREMIDACDFSNEVKQNMMDKNIRALF